MLPRQQAEEFLYRLFPQPSTGAIIRFVAMKAKAEPIERYFWHSNCTALDEMFEFNKLGYNIFVQINPCKTMGGGHISNIAYVSTIPIDLDLQKLPYTPESLIGLWGGMNLPPSINVVSGLGVHLYFLLDKPYTVAESNFIAKRVCYTSFGDMVHNPNRIMRLPGTINWKYGLPCELGRCNDNRYSLAQIESTLDAEHAPLPDEFEENEMPQVATKELTELVATLAEPWRSAVQTGKPPPGFTDMSALDWAIISELIKLYATDWQIAEIYLNWPVGQFKYNRQGNSYLVRTIQRARSTAIAEAEQNIRAAKKIDMEEIRRIFDPIWRKLLGMPPKATHEARFS
jgi:hypothetical protein